MQSLLQTKGKLSSYYQRNKNIYVVYSLIILINSFLMFQLDPTGLVNFK